MARYAVIDERTSRVVNIVEWDGKAEWSPGEGFIAELAGDRTIDAPDIPIEQAQYERIAAIKAIAQERIYAIVPAWKQTNLLARSIELLDIKEEREWTDEEIAQDAGIKALWAAVKAIRLASDVAEAAVNAAKTIEEINAINF